MIWQTTKLKMSHLFVIFWGPPPKACKQVYHYAIILHDLRSNAVAIPGHQITIIWLRKITKGRCGEKSTMEKRQRPLLINPMRVSPFYNHFTSIWAIVKNLVQSTHPWIEFQIQLLDSKLQTHSSLIKPLA
jgi:hypothetical protein